MTTFNILSIAFAVIVFWAIYLKRNKVLTTFKVFMWIAVIINIVKYLIGMFTIPSFLYTVAITYILISYILSFKKQK